MTVCAFAWSWPLLLVGSFGLALAIWWLVTDTTALSATARRFLGAVLIAVALMPAIVRAQPLGMTCQESYWSQLCGGYWCWCAWATYGCDC